MIYFAQETGAGLRNNKLVWLPYHMDAARDLDGKAIVSVMKEELVSEPLQSAQPDSKTPRRSDSVFPFKYKTRPRNPKSFASTLSRFDRRESRGAGSIFLVMNASAQLDSTVFQLYKRKYEIFLITDSKVTNAERLSCPVTMHLSISRTHPLHPVHFPEP